MSKVRRLGLQNFVLIISLKPLRLIKAKFLRLLGGKKFNPEIKFEGETEEKKARVLHFTFANSIYRLRQ